MNTPPSSAPQTESGGYRPDIDGLRAIAVSIVVAFHAKMSGFSGGFVGVDVFFVISGYLISGIISKALDKGTFSFATFYVRRIRRIVPALVMILFATSVMGWLFLYTGELTRFGWHVLAGATFISNFVLAQEIGYFDLPDRPLLHLWSLAIEEQFYLIWPAIAFVVWRRRWSPRWTLIALIEISFLANIWMVRHSMAVESFYFPISRFWEILAGALLYDLQAHPGPLIRRMNQTPASMRELASIAGALMLIISVAWFDENTLWPGFGGLLPVAGTLLLIAAGRKTRINRLVLSHPWLVAIGLISYPLYLWHWPLLVFGRLVNEGDPPVLVRVILVIIAVVLSIATYRLLELPVRFGPRRKRTVPLLLTGLAAAGVLGTVLLKGVIPGLPDASEVRNFAKWGPDWDAPGGRLVNNGKSIEVFTIRGVSRDTVLVLGDSHAEQYWPRVVRLASERNERFPTVILITYGSCPPMPGANNLGLSWERKEWRCDAIHQAAMRLAASPGVKAVMFAAFWEGYVMRKTLFLTDDPKRRLIVGNGPVLDRLFAKFELELLELRRTGKQAYIVLSNPTVQPGKRHGAPKRLQWSGRQVLAGPIPLSYVLSRTEAVAPLLRASAARTGAVIIDPVDFMCDATSCPTVTLDSMPIFRDDNHLRSGFVSSRASFVDVVFDR